MNTGINFFRVILAVLCLCSTSSWAGNAVTDRYIEQLAQGGPHTIRGVAQSIYNTGERDEQVLDVLSEVLLQNYMNNSKTDVDANAWASRALGNSANGRYRAVLEEVIEKSGNRKLEKYAKRALEQLPTDNSTPYTRGTVSLTDIKPSANSSTNQAAVQPASGGGDLVPISEVKIGMSMQEVYALCGQPTATTSHQTGKAWIPFNYKGGDVARQIGIYKGQGRVVFSNVSAYSGEWRVKEILLNANESGYP